MRLTNSARIAITSLSLTGAAFAQSSPEKSTVEAATVESGYVSVVPDAVARQVPTPQITGKETRPDAEFVTKVITVRNIPATQLVPILRPMIPQMGHLAALPCVNKLIYVDTFANLQRLQAVIEALDVGEPYKPEKCDSLPGMAKEPNVERR